MINGFKIAAVCTTRIHEGYLRDFLREFNAALADNGWRVFVYATDSDLYHKSRSDAGEALVYELIDYNVCDAAVIFAENILDPAVLEGITDAALRAGKPVLMINGSHEGAVSVSFDYEKGFELMVRHLLEHHRARNIQMIAGPKGLPVSETRIQTVKRVAAEYGVPFDSSRVRYGDFWSQPAERAAKEIAELGRLPDAIICANDTMAIAICGLYKKMGIRVPEDVIVTGFDGIEEIDFTTPRISSVRCDFGKLGTCCAELILGQAYGDRQILPDLICSESCGCEPERKTDSSRMISSIEDAFNRYRNDERKLDLIGSKVEMSRGIDEVEGHLHNRVFYDMICILKKECADPAADPLKINTDTLFGKDMVVLLDTSGDYIGRDRNMDISEIVPRLNDLLSVGKPLIFTALHFIDIPLGYLCFFFNDPGSEEYLKIGQSTGAISTCIGSYRSMKYQSRLRERVEELYRFDDLTGLYTRNGFDMEYEKLLGRGGFESVTLVLCDLDGLKYINDNFSHSEGDNAIRKVAEALKKACPGGISAKFGGDELLSFIPGRQDPERIKSEISGYLNGYNAVSRKPYEVSASVGICTAGADESFSKMFAEVDRLMYKEKAGKKHSRE